LTSVKTVNDLNKIVIKTFYEHENLDGTFKCNSAKKSETHTKKITETVRQVFNFNMIEIGGFKVLATGMPKTRGCPYHCDTGLVTTEIDRVASKSRITKPNNKNSLLLANTVIWFSLDCKRQSLKRRRKKVEKVVIPSIEVMIPLTKS